MCVCVWRGSVCVCMCVFGECMCVFVCPCVCACMQPCLCINCTIPHTDSAVTALLAATAPSASELRNYLPTASKTFLYDDHWASKQERGVPDGWDWVLRMYNSNELVYCRTTTYIRTYVCICLKIQHIHMYVCMYVLDIEQLL